MATNLTIEQLTAWSEALAKVIGSSFNTDSTLKPLCEAISELIPVDYSAVFVLRQGKPPLEILDEVPKNALPIRYPQSPYLLDPIFDHFLKGTLPATALLDDLSPDEFFESDYFREYWNVLELVSEFGINAWYDDNTVIHMPLSRSKGSPPFSKREIEVLSASAPVVIAIMIRFWDARGESLSPDDDTANSFHGHLQYVLENFGSTLLTTRELEIVRLTMRGFSDKLAARELDISPGTVRNHKKSIFRKLQVSSQGQVFGLFLEVLQLPAGELEGPDPLATLLALRKAEASMENI